ncbi:CehA/McbA family metallohydrolase [Duganella aceris]|nr:CehA/McbA family metallohydrolase [Duganella aceris]
MTVDHQEFDATLQAPFRADADGGRELTLHFAQQAGRVRWRLELLAPAGDTVLRRWRGEHLLGDALPVTVKLRWQHSARTPAGIYRLRLRASLDGAQDIEQLWPGWPAPAPATPATAPAAIAAVAAPPATAPYTIYLGNLHSQTGHSDGGGALGQCSGAQAPQSAPLGPTDAYAYALARHLDFLMTSEHNHMYDGSDGTMPDADPAAARALFHNGRHQADTWNLAHDNFLALYGQEWGVISHGGHLNILNGGELLGWERNAQGALLADVETPKNDYAALYTLMRRRGWLGQFNHPQQGQFAVDGQPLAWTPDGDEAMLLCEVVNSNAFSSSTDESEPRRSNFESGCNALLEAGYHIAFSSNQDNHCANWGASYSNRTGVLLPSGAPLTTPNFLEALKARRVFATMDKQAQLILTGNGHLMGERFSNRGRLTLKAGYASKNGRSATLVTLFHGVPGRNGQVGVLANKAELTTTPKPGEHFYYARVTQDDGKMLWSAPIWVTQIPH